MRIRRTDPAPSERMPRADVRASPRHLLSSRIPGSVRGCRRARPRGPGRAAPLGMVTRSDREHARGATRRAQCRTDGVRAERMPSLAASACWSLGSTGASALGATVVLNGASHGSRGVTGRRVRTVVGGRRRGGDGRNAGDVLAPRWIGAVVAGGHAVSRRPTFGAARRDRRLDPGCGRAANRGLRRAVARAAGRRADPSRRWTSPGAASRRRRVALARPTVSSTRGVSRRAGLWIAFVIVHLGVAARVSACRTSRWATSTTCTSRGRRALGGGGIVGITEPWVYPQLALLARWSSRRD